MNLDKICPNFHSCYKLAKFTTPPPFYLKSSMQNVEGMAVPRN
jgi:hypothetical protein